jgi:CRISPR-associated protein Cas6
MPSIDLLFPLVGPSIGTDHGYELYSALSRLLPALHDGLPCRIAPVRGTYAGKATLQLDVRYSRLRLRLAPEVIPQLLPLVGQALDVGGHLLRLGVPQVRALIPAPGLAARLVTIKGFTEPAEFLAAARRQLDALEVQGAAGIPLADTGVHAGKPRRRVLLVRGKRVVGFPLLVTELSAEESLRLQEHGLGGRGKMGCGFFLPARSS